MPTFLGTNSNDTITPSLVTPGVVTPPGTLPGVGNDTIYGWAGLDKLGGGGGDDLLFGGLDADSLYGNTGKDWLNGDEGNDTLQGGGDSDTLDGGTGNDMLIGEGGDDTYVVDSTGDIVMELVDTAAGGNDVVQSSVSWTLGFGLERLVLTGFGAINGAGNTGNNTITGNGMANKLDGG
jgi:Ca2+-binding RTX toxin-like protein